MITVEAVQPQQPKDLPFLQALCWQGDAVRAMTAEEALARYERGWRYRGVVADLGEAERGFIAFLARTHGSWLNGAV